MFHSIQSITPICDQLHADNQRIVLATGFFDLLHEEHINFLEKAKAAGDILIVGVESDERARKLKGEGRPVETQSIRCQHLLDLSSKRANVQSCKRTVDYVISLQADFDNPAAFESLIAAVRPAFLAVSSHTLHQDKKAALISKYGGVLKIVHDHNPTISTTQHLKQ